MHKQVKVQILELCAQPCHKKEHTRKFYYKLKQDIREEKRVANNNNNIVVIVRDDLLFACDENITHLVSHETSCIIDSGATSHDTPRKNFFSPYTLVDSRILLNMDSTSEVKAFVIGTVCLKTNKCSTLVLHNVKHAPNFPLNLI